MCGVPHHAAEAYIAQLLEKNHRVAVCDQIEDPRQAKGLVKRAVTRVLTPGTVVDDRNLEAKSHNYLAALFWDSDKGAGGLAWADVSTGEWSGLYASREPELWQWALKIDPRELLLARQAPLPRQYRDMEPRVVRLEPPGSADEGAEERILASQRTASLEVLDLTGKDQLVQAMGALLSYLEETQKHDAAHMGQFSCLNPGRHLVVDEMTEKNLELFRRLDGGRGPGTLLHVLDETVTPMGGRLLHERLAAPWRDLNPVRASQEGVAFFAGNDQLRGDLRRALDEVYDLERLSTRIFLGRAHPKDFTALRSSLARLPRIRQTLKDHLNDVGEDAPPAPKGILDILSRWDDLEDVHDKLVRALVDNPPPVVTEGGLFREGFDPELDEVLKLAEKGEEMLAAMLKDERARGLPKLKMGYNRVFGYYFELSRSGDSPVPDHFVRRQTLANAERYVTDGLKELEEKLLSASDKRKELEYRLFQQFRQELADLRPRFLFMAGCVAGLDYWQGLAQAARKRNWTRPELSTDPVLRVTKGRHPVVEAAMGRSDYVPNDLVLDESGRILVITGPNMAGKSTVLRMAALMAVLAQMGSYVPANKAVVGLSDRVFSRVGASDNLAAGQSTFMVEMMETARILRQAGPRSLVILDEIGRGTSTFDGMALARAVVEDLARKGGGIRTLFATHYHELTALEHELDHVRNYNVAVKEWKGEIIFLRRMVPGPADKSYGIEVARLAGVPQPVVRRARELLAELERARDLDHRPAPLPQSRAMLPGLAQKPVDGDDHPVLERLRRARVEAMTPLEALGLIQELKDQLDKDEE